MMALVQGRLIHLVLRRFGDRNTVIYGQVFDFFAFGALALVTGIHALSMIVSPLMMATMFAAFTRDGVCFYAQGVPFAVSMALIAPGFSCLSVAQYRPGRERET